MSLEAANFQLVQVGPELGPEVVSFYADCRQSTRAADDRHTHWPDCDDANIAKWIEAGEIYAITPGLVEMGQPDITAAIRLDESKEAWPEPGILPDRSLHLSRYATSPDVQGRGFTGHVLAPLLLEFVADQDYGSIHLEVLASNKRLNDFYRTVAKFTFHGAIDDRTPGTDEVLSMNRYSFP